MYEDNGFNYQETGDGDFDIELLPKDHNQRVKALCAQLMSAKPPSEAFRIILHTRFDGTLEPRYADTVVREALNLLCQWMISDANPLDTTILCDELPRMILALRTDRDGEIARQALAAQAALRATQEAGQ